MAGDVRRVRVRRRVLLGRSVGQRAVGQQARRRSGSASRARRPHRAAGPFAARGRTADVARRRTRRASRRAPGRGRPRSGGRTGPARRSRARDRATRSSRPRAARASRRRDGARHRRSTDGSIRSIGSGKLRAEAFDGGLEQLLELRGQRTAGLDPRRRRPVGRQRRRPSRSRGRRGRRPEVTVRGAREHPEQQLDIRHGPGHDAVRDEIEPERCRAATDQPVRRFQPDKAAQRGRPARRSARVRRGRDGHHAGGQGHRRPARRAAGRPGGVPRVQRPAEQPVLGDPFERELGRVRLADRDRAGRPEQPHDPRVGRGGRRVGEQQRPVGRREALRGPRRP